MCTQNLFRLRIEFARSAPRMFVAACAVAGMLSGLSAAQEPEEPCILDLSLRPLEASRDVILAGQSSQLDWAVTFPANPACASRVSVFLVQAGATEHVGDIGPKTVSLAATTSYRLKAVDREQSNPRLQERLLGNAVTVTVLQPPPSPPNIDCP